MQVILKLGKSKVIENEIPACNPLKENLCENPPITHNLFGPLLVKNELSEMNSHCTDDTFFRLIDGNCYIWIPIEVTNVDAARRHCLE